MVISGIDWHILKGARHDLANALAKVVHQCALLNDDKSWKKLLLFPYVTLKIPDQNENVTNLTSYVRQNINEWNVHGLKSILSEESINSSENVCSVKMNDIFKKAEV